MVVRSNIVKLGKKLIQLLKNCDYHQEGLLRRPPGPYPIGTIYLRVINSEDFPFYPNYSCTLSINAPPNSRHLVKFIGVSIDK